MNRGRIVLNGVLIVALVGGGFVAWQSTQSSAASVSIGGSVETVKKSDLVATVSASGNVESETATKVNFAQSGTVVEVLVVEGQAVNAGDVLARIDDSAQRIALTSAKSSLTSAQAKAQKTQSGLTKVEVEQNAAAASQSEQTLKSSQVSLSNARSLAEANKQTYQLSVDQAVESLVDAETALATARTKAVDDNAAAQVSVDSARTALATATTTAAHDDETAKASVETAKTTAAHDNEVAQTSVDTAQKSLTDGQAQLDLFRNNLTVAQTSFDAKPGVKELGWIDVVSRYTDAQTNCKDKSVTAFDEITCNQVSYLLSLAQTGQKQESSVKQNQTSLVSAQNTQVSTREKGKSSVVTAQNSQLSTSDKGMNSITSAQTTLTNALNTQRTTKSTGEQSITSMQEKLTSAQNSLDNARNTQKTSVLKDAQSIKSAEESVAGSKKSYEVQLAGNKVKEKPPTADQIAADQSSVQSAQEQVKKAQENLDDTVLKAPLAAIVASVSGAVGDTVTSGGTGGAETTGSTFMTLTDPNRLRIKVGFSEADALRIRVGQPAKVTMEAASDRAFTGAVTSLDPTQTLVNNVVTYYATVNLVGDLDGVRSGMSATVDVTTDTRSQVLSLPTRAIKSSSSTATVIVRATTKNANGKSITGDAPKQIVVGLRGDERVEIVSGLADGDQVVVQSSGGGLPGGFKLPAGGPGGGGLGGGL